MRNTPAHGIRTGEDLTHALHADSEVVCTPCGAPSLILSRVRMTSIEIPTPRHGGDKSYLTFCSTQTKNGKPHFDPFRPHQKDVEAGITWILEKGTMGAPNFRKVLCQLSGHWQHAHPDGLQRIEDSPFSVKYNKQLDSYVNALLRRLQVNPGAACAERAAIRPSVMFEVKIFAVRLTDEMRQGGTAAYQRLPTLRCCILMLVAFTWGLRGVNAYFLVLGGNLRIHTKTQAVSVYYTDMGKDHNDQSRGARGKGKSTKDVNKPRTLRGGAWTEVLISLLTAYNHWRKEHAKHLDSSVPQQFFLLAGEAPVSRDNACSAVNEWTKDVLHIKLSTINLRLHDFETLNGHSYREGMASSLHHIHGDNQLKYIRWWGGWEQESPVVEKAYLKNQTWAEEEREPANYFFGMHRGSGPLPVQRGSHVYRGATSQR